MGSNGPVVLAKCILEVGSWIAIGLFVRNSLDPYHFIELFFVTLVVGSYMRMLFGDLSASIFDYFVLLA